MTISSGARTPQSTDTGEAESILLQLLDSLNRLDGIGAPVAAAYVQTAVDHLRGQFNLDEHRSETD